jgi:hypothetical protein
MAKNITTLITQKAVLGGDSGGSRREHGDDDDYDNCNLPVLCQCQTWSLIVREEHMVRVLENRLLRKILGCERNSR